MGVKRSVRTSKNSPGRIAKLERQNIALELRKQGGTYQQIAEQMRTLEGVPDTYSMNTVYRDISAALQDLREICTEKVEEVATINLLRIDTMFQKNWEFASKGDQAAMVRAMELMERADKYNGYNTYLRAQQQQSASVSFASEGGTAPPRIREIVVHLQTNEPPPETASPIEEANAETSSPETQGGAEA